MARVFILLVLNLSGLETNMRGSLHKDRELAVVYILGLMVTYMKENSNKDRNMAGEDIFSKMMINGLNMMENGLIIFKLGMEQ